MIVVIIAFLSFFVGTILGYITCLERSNGRLTKMEARRNEEFGDAPGVVREKYTLSSKDRRTDTRGAFE